MVKRMAPFEGFGLRDFWKPSKYWRQQYVDDLLPAAKIALCERALNVTLPPSYVALMKTQNGGIPNKTCHRTRTPTSWAEDHVAVSGLFSIGDSKTYSLCGR